MEIKDLPSDMQQMAEEIISSARFNLNALLGVEVNVGFAGKGDISAIERVVQEVTGFSLEAMRGRTRKEDVSLARHLFCYSANAYAGKSHKAIGKILLRGRDTISHDIERVRGLLANGDVLMCEALKAFQVKYFNL